MDPVIAMLAAGAGYLIDPLGTVVTSLAALLLGMLARNILVAYSGGTWVMIPWLWFHTGGSRAFGTRGCRGHHLHGCNDS
jgi:hypothetical protein